MMAVLAPTVGPTDVALVAVLVAGLAGAIRALRINITVDDTGISVANYFRSRHFAWHEVTGVVESRMFVGLFGLAADQAVIAITTKRRERPFPAQATVGLRPRPKHELQSLLQSKMSASAAPNA